MTVLKLAVGSRVWYDGEAYTVVGLDRSAARLRGRSGNLTLIAVGELLDRGEILGEGGKGPFPSLRADALEGMTDAARKLAESRLSYLREAETGYRSGDPEDPAPDEPRPGYDPALTSLTERVRTKASETGCSVSTLHRWRKDYRDGGLHALADGRESRARYGGRSLDPRARRVFLELIAGLTDKSNLSKRRVIEEVKKRLDEEYGEGVVPLPSLSSLYRALKELTEGKETFGNAKRRREIAARPRTPYQRFDATRPGETVLIDATRLDVFALDPATLRWTSLDLVLALDVFTRSLLAWRFVPRGSKAVDAALLLRDVVSPKAVRPGWPGSTRWPYHGVPERIVLGAFEGMGGAVAGSPVVRPETVVVDRDKIFESLLFREACRAMGISVQPARPYTPTDKAQIEATFRTIRESLLERMPGYKGPDLASRGLGVEEDSYYFIHEVEEIFASWVVEHWQNRPHDALHLPGAPKQRMTPNEAYDLGLATAGFLYVPPDPELYYELLPIAARKIHHYGVTIGRLTYDGDALNYYRGLPNPNGGRFAKKWPIRLDPRNLSRAYFKDPEDDTWHELPWVHAPSLHRPFNDRFLMHAKALLAAKRGRTDGDSRELGEIVAEIFERVERGRLLDAKERAAVARAAIHADQAARDRGNVTSPSRRNADEEESVAARDDEDAGSANIKPYPVWGDAGYEDYLPGEGVGA